MERRSEYSCEISCIHEDAVKEVQEKMLAEETGLALAEVFRTLGDPTRVKLLYALSVQCERETFEQLILLLG